MTTVIDERVVEMRFNNSDFEKNVAQSMKTLDELKNSLNFDSAKSLENIGKAAKNFSLAGITDTITEATSKFSVLEIAGITAISKITSAAMDMGINFAKSLSIDQVSKGFDKYAEKTQAVQTIMAATSDQFSNQAEQMEYVNEQLEKLVWFTDETSYNMIDMTSNIGKFVSNNVALEDAVTAMEGIATWAGLSGAGTQKASIAMYNFAQAIGAGAMKRQDWKSIENANMATAKFKQTAIETAVELGKLNKAADGVYTTLDGKGEVTVEKFAEELKRGWFDTEVMTATLNKFGGFADELNKLYNSTDLTTSELLERLDEYKAGNKDLSDVAENSTMSLQELQEQFDKLTSSEFDLGKKAFAASQEAKTFKEAIDSVVDAVSSGWMNTFEILFGNYIEAKTLWTALANDLYDMFAEGGNQRNEVLKVWKELGGRDSLIMGAVNALNLLIKPINAVKTGFMSIFPPGKQFGRILADGSAKFADLMEKLQPSQAVLQNIAQLVRGISLFAKSLIGVLTSIIKLILPVTRPFGSIIEMIFAGLGIFGKLLEILADFIENNNVVAIGVTLLKNAFASIIPVLKTIGIILGGAILIGIKLFISVISKARDIVVDFVTMVGSKLPSIGTKISGAFSKVIGIFKNFNLEQFKLGDALAKIPQKFMSFIQTLGKYKNAIGEALAKHIDSESILCKFISAFEKVKTTLGNVIGGPIVAGINAFMDAITKLTTAVKNFISTIGTKFAAVGSGISSTFSKFVGIFKGFKKEEDSFGSAIGEVPEKASIVKIALQKIELAFENLKHKLSGAKTVFEKVVIVLGTVVKAISTLVGGAAIGALSTFVFLITNVGTAIHSITGLASRFSSAVGGKLSSAINKITNFTSKFTKKGKESKKIINQLDDSFGDASGAILDYGDATEDVNSEVEENNTLLGKLHATLLKARDLFVASGKTLGVSLMDLGKKFITFFTDFKTRFETATKNAQTWTDKLKGFFATIKTYLDEAWVNIKEFFAQFDINLDTFKDAVETITKALGDLITTLGPGRIAAFLFATAMLALVGSVIKFADQIKLMFGAVTGVFNNVNKILKKQFAKSSVITDLAKAFAIIAASLTLLAMVPAEDLDRVANVMFKLMIAFSVCAAVLRALDVLLAKFVTDTDFKLINANLLALAGSMAILVGTFAVLNYIELKDDWMEKLKVMGILMLELVAASALLSRLAPQLSKGSILLLTIALSMKLMVDSLAKIGEKDIDGINKNLKGFTFLFIGLAAMVAAAGKLKLTSALNLIIIAKVLEYVLPTLTQTIEVIAPYINILSEKLNEIIDKLIEIAITLKDKLINLIVTIKESFDNLIAEFTELEDRPILLTRMIGRFAVVITGIIAAVGSLFAIGYLLTAIGSLGNLLKGAGLAIIGLAVAINLVVEAIKELATLVQELGPEDTDAVLSAFTQIVKVMGGAIAVIAAVAAVGGLISKLGHNEDGKFGLFDKGFKTSFLGIAISFLAIAGAMKLIMYSLQDLKALQDATGSNFDILISAMEGLLICLGIAAAGAGLIRKGVPVLVAFIGIATTLALVIAEIAILSTMLTKENLPSMLGAIGIMAGVFVGLIWLVTALSKLDKAGPLLSLTLPVLGMVMSIVGMIIVLASLQNVNVPALVTGLVGLGVIFGELIALFIIISKTPALGTALKSKLLLLHSCIEALLLAELALVLMGVAVNQIGALNIGVGLAYISLALAALMAMFDDIAKMPSLGNGLAAKIKLLHNCMGLFALVAVAIGGLAVVITQFGGQLPGAATALGSLLICMWAIYRFMTIINDIQVTNGAKARYVLLYHAIGSIALLAIAIGSLTVIASKYGKKSMLTGLGSLLGAMAILLGTMAILNRFHVTQRTHNTIILLWHCVAAMGILSFALFQLSKHSQKNTIGALGTLAGATGALVVLLGVVALIGNISNVKSIVGMIGLLVSAAGSMGILAYALYKLAEIDSAQLSEAEKTMEALMSVMNTFLLVVAVLEAVFGAVGAALGAEVGAGIGVAVLPVAMIAIASSFVEMALALKIGADAIKSLTGAMSILVDCLEDLSELPLADLVKNLNGLAWPLAKVGGALLVFGFGGGVASLGIIALAIALRLLVPSLDDFSTSMESLSHVNFESVASGMWKIAVAGAALGTASGAIIAGAFAVGKLADAMNLYNSAKGGGSTFNDRGHTGSSGKLPSATKVITETGELMETYSKEMPKYGANFTQEYASGILTKADDVNSATKKVVDGQVQILDEAVPKAGEAVEASSQKVIEVNETMYKTLVETAEQTGYEVGDGYVKALDGTIYTKTPTIGERFMGLFKEKVSDPVVKTFTQSGADSVNGFVSEFTNGKVTDVGMLFSNLDFRSIFEQLGIEAEGGFMGVMDSMFNLIGRKLGIISGAMSTLNSQLGTEAARAEKFGKEFKGVYEKKQTGKGLLSGLFGDIAGFDPLEYVKKLGDAFTDAGDAGAEGAEGVGAFSDAAGKAGKSAKDLKKSLKDTIENQLDIFSKFEIKTGITGKQMIENMRSNIDGFASWSHRMAVLAQRFAEAGIDKGLYQKLAEMGPKGYETMNAFYEMSAEELAEVKDLYATSLTLPESQANIVGQGYEYMGQMAIQGFSNALDDHFQAHEAIHGFTKDVIDTAAEDLGVHSPSTVFFDLAYNCLLGYWEGTVVNIHWARDAANFIVKTVLDIFDDNFTEDRFHEYGKNVVMGLAHGIKDEEAVALLSESIMGILELLNLTVEEEEEIGSPSKLMRRYGRFITEGLAIGITDAAENVRSAAEYVTDMTDEAFSYGLSGITNLVDLDSTILLTPILDTSVLDEQLSGLNETIGVTGQNKGISRTEPTTINNNYTQNNYSPKALSRTEIYRQTRNQLSMLKSVNA